MAPKRQKPKPKSKKAKAKARPETPPPLTHGPDYDPDLKFQLGEDVWCQWNEIYYKAKINEICLKSDEQYYRVHFWKFGRNWDRPMPENMIMAFTRENTKFVIDNNRIKGRLFREQRQALNLEIEAEKAMKKVQKNHDRIKKELLKRIEGKAPKEQEPFLILHRAEILPGCSKFRTHGDEIFPLSIDDGSTQKSVCLPSPPIPPTPTSVTSVDKEREAMELVAINVLGKLRIKKLRSNSVGRNHEDSQVFNTSYDLETNLLKSTDINFTAAESVSGTNFGFGPINEEFEISKPKEQLCLDNDHGVITNLDGEQDLLDGELESSQLKTTDLNLKTAESAEINLVDKQVALDEIGSTVKEFATIEPVEQTSLDVEIGSTVKEPVEQTSLDVEIGSTVKEFETIEPVKQISLDVHPCIKNLKDIGTSVVGSEEVLNASVELESNQLKTSTAKSTSVTHLDKEKDELDEIEPIIEEFETSKPEEPLILDDQSGFINIKDSSDIVKSSCEVLSASVELESSPLRTSTSKSTSEKYLDKEKDALDVEIEPINEEFEAFKPEEQLILDDQSGFINIKDSSDIVKSSSCEVITSHELECGTIITADKIIETNSHDKQDALLDGNIIESGHFNKEFKSSKSEEQLGLEDELGFINSDSSDVDKLSCEVLNTSDELESCSLVIVDSVIETSSNDKQDALLDETEPFNKELETSISEEQLSLDHHQGFINSNDSSDLYNSCREVLKTSAVLESSELAKNLKLTAAVSQPETNLDCEQELLDVDDIGLYEEVTTSEPEEQLRLDDQDDCVNLQDGLDVDKSSCEVLHVKECCNPSEITDSVVVSYPEKHSSSERYAFSVDNIHFDEMVSTNPEEHMRSGVRQHSRNTDCSTADLSCCFINKLLKLFHNGPCRITGVAVVDPRLGTAKNLVDNARNTQNEEQLIKLETTIGPEGSLILDSEVSDTSVLEKNQFKNLSVYLRTTPMSNLENNFDDSGAINDRAFNNNSSLNNSNCGIASSSTALTHNDSEYNDIEDLTTDGDMDVGKKVTLSAYTSLMNKKKDEGVYSRKETLCLTNELVNKKNTNDHESEAMASKVDFLIPVRKRKPHIKHKKRKSYDLDSNNIVHDCRQDPTSSDNSTSNKSNTEIENTLKSTALTNNKVVINDYRSATEGDNHVEKSSMHKKHKKKKYEHIYLDKDHMDIGDYQLSPKSSSASIENWSSGSVNSSGSVPLSNHQVESDGQTTDDDDQYVKKRKVPKKKPLVDIYKLFGYDKTYSRAAKVKANVAISQMSKPPVGKEKKNDCGKQKKNGKKKEDEEVFGSPTNWNKLGLEVPNFVRKSIITDKHLLLDDRYIVSLPAKVTVYDILKDYSSKFEACPEILMTILESFSISLNYFCLHPLERPKYYEMLEKYPEKKLYNIYGLPHLIRFLVKLPLVIYTFKVDTEDDFVRRTTRFVHGLFVYLHGENMELSLRDYECIMPDYYRQAYVSYYKN